MYYSLRNRLQCTLCGRAHRAFEHGLGCGGHRQVHAAHHTRTQQGDMGCGLPANAPGRHREPCGIIQAHCCNMQRHNVQRHNMQRHTWGRVCLFQALHVLVGDVHGGCCETLEKIWARMATETHPCAMAESKAPNKALDPRCGGGQRDLPVPAFRPIAKQSLQHPMWRTFCS